MLDMKEISPNWYVNVDDDYAETGTCCLCGGEYTHWGNNPYPLSENPNDRCCDVCNATKVIPARIMQMIERKESDNNETLQG